MTGNFRGEAGAFAVSNGPNGVLVLHGFTGTPYSVRPLAEALVDAGFSVEVPLLAGHGTTVEALESTGYEDWLGAARTSYAKLAESCERVIAAGLSLGGTLALELATEVALAGVVVINPYVVPPAESFLEMMRKALDQGVRTIPSIGSDIARPEATSKGYDATPVASLLSLFAGAASLYPRLSNFKVPTLLFSSRVDHIVPIESGDALAERLDGRLERVFLEHSYHVATLDADAELIQRKTVAFCRSRVEIASARS